MIKNLSNTDRAVRLILAAAIAGLFLTHVIGGAAGYILLVVAAILLITSFVSFCPLYYMLGLSTNKKKV